LALFPVLRIVRPMIDPAHSAGLRAFGAFYVMDRLRDVFSTSLLAEQALFLFEMLAGLALMAWILRPRRLEGVELSRAAAACGRSGSRPGSCSSPSRSRSHRERWATCSSRA
jgi:hypothetical protein